MKITKVVIGRWRNFSGIEISIPSEVGLVCLIGENGTGKSNMLELLSIVAHHFGLTPGAEARRGQPLGEHHEDLEVHLALSSNPRELLGTELWESLRGINVDGWNGNLIFKSDSRPGRGGIGIFAGGDGFEDGGAAVGVHITQWLRQFSEVRHVYLDADRAYPPRPIQPGELAQAMQEMEAGGIQEAMTRRLQLASQSSRNLYDRWARDLMAIEQREAMRLVQMERIAQENGDPRPPFQDQFESYREALQRVLPHLNFEGVVGNALAFNSAGETLQFEGLSGGEREIAFLVGQIDQFKLTRGLLLLDEPELHLNPDLLRAWLEFILEGISDGQVWIATHAMEAVEVAGAEASFVFEREKESRIVSHVAKLKERGAVAILSRAVGSPAFSLQNLRFIYVEGERAGASEKERFYELCGQPRTHRFMPAGGFKEVIRSVESLRYLAAETGEAIGVGGVVDRDFKTDSEVQEIREKTSVFVLDCHEIENLYLSPVALDRIDSSIDAADIIRGISDAIAGKWIVQHAFARGEFRAAYIPASRALRVAAGQANWQAIDSDASEVPSRWAGLQPDLTPQERLELESSISSAIGAFRDARGDDEFWKECMGKEVLAQIPSRYGFNRPRILERAVQQQWQADDSLVPDELRSLRQYVEEIEPSTPD